MSPWTHHFYRTQMFLTVELKLSETSSGHIDHYINSLSAFDCDEIQFILDLNHYYYIIVWFHYLTYTK